MAHLLGAEVLTLRYPTQVVFDDLTVGINDGDRIGIVGRNGDGKSSLLGMLSGRIEPDSGRVTRRGGVRVAAADFDGDGLAEVVTGRGRGSRPFAQVLKVSTLIGSSAQPTLTSLQAVNVFGDAYSNGIYVGA